MMEELAWGYEILVLFAGKIFFKKVLADTG